MLIIITQPPFFFQQPVIDLVRNCLSLTEMSGGLAGMGLSA
jgi:hypothetical protein